MAVTSGGAPQGVSTQAIIDVMKEEAGKRLGPETLARHFGPAVTDEKPHISPPAIALSPQETEDAIAEVHEKVKALIEKDLTYAVRGLVGDEGADVNLETNGRMNPLGQTTSGTADKEKRKRQRNQDKLVNDLVMQQLLDDLARIDAEIAANNKRIEEIDRELSEIDQLDDLIASGELDPSDPRHKAMMDKYRITQEDIDNGTAQDKLDATRSTRQSERDALDKRNQDLQQQKEATHDAIEKRQAEIRSDPSRAIETRSARAGALDDNIDRYLEQLDVQEAGADDASLLEERNAISAQMYSLEDEVCTFEKGYAEAQKIEDPMKRLEREKELVEALSEEAAELISFNEDTEHLFGDKYFATLDTQEQATAEVTQTAAVVASLPGNGM
ncbi:MAG: hypothetical protein AAF720_01415 [Pseudomonadota bacterium]